MKYRIPLFSLVLAVCGFQIFTNAQPATAADRVIPSWNPNGRIYFKTGAQKEGDVYSVKDDGTDLKPFITTPGEDYAPRWTHDGKRGVFMSERDGDFEIYSIN